MPLSGVKPTSPVLDLTKSINSGLVAALPMSDGSGTNITELVSGRDASITVATGYWQTGDLGAEFQFSGNNGRITTDWTDEYHHATFSHLITLYCSETANAEQQDYGFFFADWYMRMGSNGSAILSTDGAGNNQLTPGALPENQYVQILITSSAEAEDDRRRVYYNGEIKDEDVGVDPPFVTSSENMVMGESTYMKTRVVDVRYWSRELTSGEALELFNDPWYAYEPTTFTGGGANLEVHANDPSYTTTGPQTIDLWTSAVANNAPTPTFEIARTRGVELEVTASLTDVEGNSGDSLSPIIYKLENTSTGAFRWRGTAGKDWITLSSKFGTIDSGEIQYVTGSIDSNQPDGHYNALAHFCVLGHPYEPASHHVHALIGTAPTQVGNTYYIDFASGDDSSDGLSTGNAWKHHPGDDQASGSSASKTPDSGERYVFKGGTSYHGRIAMSSSWGGTSTDPVFLDGNTRNEWGGSERAIMDGAVAALNSGDWTATGGGAYFATLPSGYEWQDVNLCAGDRQMFLSQGPHKPEDQLEYHALEQMTTLPETGFVDEVVEGSDIFFTAPDLIESTATDLTEILAGTTVIVSNSSGALNDGTFTVVSTTTNLITVNETIVTQVATPTIKVADEAPVGKMTDAAFSALSTGDADWWVGAWTAIWIQGNRVQDYPITDVSGDTVTYTNTNSELTYTDRDGYYAIVNSRAYMTGAGDYWVDTGNSRIYCIPYEESDITEGRITYSDTGYSHAFFASDVENVRVSGFKALRYTSAATAGGIGISKTHSTYTDNINFDSNEFALYRAKPNSGGNVVSGTISFSTETSNSSFEGNSVHQNINCRGINMAGGVQQQEDMNCSHNLLYRLGGSGILSQSTLRLVMDDNIIANNRAAHANGTAIYQNTDNPIIRNSYIGDGLIPITIQDCSGAEIHNNTLYSPSDGSTCISNWNGSVRGTSNAKIYNNVLKNDVYTVSIGWSHTAANTGITYNDNEIRNNVISRAISQGASIISDHNIYIDTGLMDSGVGSFTGAAADLFTDPDNWDYTLKAGSLAIDAGVDVGLPFEGSAPDIGAFESEAITATTGTLSEANLELNAPDPTLNVASPSEITGALGEANLEFNAPDLIFDQSVDFGESNIEINAKVLSFMPAKPILPILDISQDINTGLILAIPLGEGTGTDIAALGGDETGVSLINGDWTVDPTVGTVVDFTSSNGFISNDLTGAAYEVSESSLLIVMQLPPDGPGNAIDIGFAPSGTAWWARSSESARRWILRGGTGNSISTDTWSSDLDGSWAVLVLTMSTDNARRRLFMNGVQIGADYGEVEGIDWNANTIGLLLGRALGSWHMPIADFRYWDRELTSNEIEILYNDPWASYASAHELYLASESNLVLNAPNPVFADGQTLVVGEANLELNAADPSVEYTMILGEAEIQLNGKTVSSLPTKPVSPVIDSGKSINNGLIAALPINDGSGTTVSELVSSANGTLSVDSWSTDSILGTVIDLLGTSGSIATNWTGGDYDTDEFTVSLVLRVPSSGNFSVSGGADLGFYPAGWWMRSTDDASGTPRRWMLRGGGGTDTWVGPWSSDLDGSWAVFTFTGSISSDRQLFVNGILIGTAPALSALDWGTITSQMYIGRGGAAPLADTQIADARMWNRELTDDEVLSLYENPWEGYESDSLTLGESNLELNASNPDFTSNQNEAIGEANLELNAPDPTLSLSGATTEILGEVNLELNAPDPILTVPSETTGSLGEANLEFNADNVEFIVEQNIDFGTSNLEVNGPDPFYINVQTLDLGEANLVMNAATPNFPEPLVPDPGTLSSEGFTEPFGAITVGSGRQVLPAPVLVRGYNDGVRSYSDTEFSWNAVSASPRFDQENESIPIPQESAATYTFEITPDLGWSNKENLFEPYISDQKLGNPHLKKFTGLTIGSDLTDIVIPGSINDKLTYTIDGTEFIKLLSAYHGVFLWRVVGVREDGVEGYYSEIQRFKSQVAVTDLDWTINPIDSKSRSLTFSISGTKSPNVSTVEINGSTENTLATTSTTWSAEIPLSEINTDLTMRAIDSKGNSSAYKIIEVSIPSDTQNYRPVWNSFDEFGMLVDLTRLPEERNLDYRTRTLDVYKHRSSPRYKGLVNGITRELNIAYDDTGMTVTPATDSLTKNAIPGVHLEISPSYISVDCDMYQAHSEYHVLDNWDWSITLDNWPIEDSMVVESPLGTKIESTKWDVEYDKVVFSNNDLACQPIYVSYRYSKRFGTKNKTVSDVKTWLSAVDHSGELILSVNTGQDIDTGTPASYLAMTPRTEVVENTYQTYGPETNTGMPIRWSNFEIKLLNDPEYFDDNLNTENTHFGTDFERRAEYLKSLIHTQWGYLVADRNVWSSEDRPQSGGTVLPTTYDPRLSYWQGSSPSSSTRYSSSEAYAYNYVDPRDGSDMVYRGVQASSVRSGIGDGTDLLVKIVSEDATQLVQSDREITTAIRIERSGGTSVDGDPITGSGSFPENGILEL